MLVALYVLRFLPAYEYRQFPFLPVSITDGYVNSGFQLTNFTSHSGGSQSPNHFGGDGYSSEFLPNLTHGPGGVYPTSATTNGSKGSSSRYHGGSVLDRGGSGEVSRVIVGDPVPVAPPNKWLADVYSLIALIVMTVVSLVYLILLFIYVRQLIYEDSGHVFGHAQSVTRNVAFYVQPQFAQSGNSDNKLTNSPSPALRSQALHSLQNQQQANCTQPISNTQIPSEFLPQPQNQQSRQSVGNHLKPGNSVDSNNTALQHKDTKAQYQHQQTTQSQISQQQQNQSQNHIQQRSPVPPAREMQQNIQTQQQQQVITIYPQKGGGFTSSSSSPRMQVKFAKPLEQHNPSHGGDPGNLPEPPRSCLANPGTSQQQQPQLSCSVASSLHMMSPPPQQQQQPQSQCQQRLDPGRNLAVAPGGQYQQMHGQQHQGQHCFPPAAPPHAHIPGHPGPPYTHQQPPPPQHMPYHGKSRAQQQSCYNDMVDNSSYLVFSGNPNTSNLVPAAPAPPPLHSTHMASASHTYPHCSQRRPSGSMV